MNTEPIKSQKEADEVRHNLAAEASKRLNISAGQALRRIDAFNEVQDDILNHFKIKSPEEDIYKFIVDIAMRIPQK